MIDYKAKAKEMAKARLERMGGKSSDRADKIMRASGGRICKADGGPMEPDGDEFDSGAEMDGEESKPRLDKPNRGGKTTINIMVSGKSDAPGAGAPPPMPLPPPPAPPMAGPPGPPPGMPPMPMRANGGRVQRADGGSVAKDRWPLLSIERQKYANEKDRESNESAAKNGLFSKKTSDANREKFWARSGDAEVGREDRARGGRMTAGSGSGEGRLEKDALARKHK